MLGLLPPVSGVRYTSNMVGTGWSSGLCANALQPMVRGTVTDALGGAPSVPSQGMSPHDVELSQYDPTAAADSAAGPSMQLR